MTKTLRIAWALAAALCLAGEISAQQLVRLRSDFTEGTIDADGDTVELTLQDMGSFGSVKVQTKDSYAGTWQVECAPDGENYDTTHPLTIKPQDSATTDTTVTNTVGTWDVVNAGGCFAIRVHATAGFAASDTALVISASQTGGGASVGAGGGGGGGDASAANQDEQTALLTTIAADTATSLTVQQSIDSNIDYIRDNLALEATHGNAALPTGSQAMAEFDDTTPATVDEGDAGRLRISANRNLYTTLRDAAGNERGANVNASNQLTTAEGGALLTSAQLLDDTVFTDEGSFTYATSKVLGLGAVAESTTDAIADGAMGALTMDLARRLIVTPTPSTYGGLSIFRSIDLDAAEVIKASPGQIYSAWITNTATATRFIKLYDATSCTAGSGTPVITFPLPGNASDDVAGHLTGGGMGIAFSTGICITATTAVADNDSGDPGANEVVANVFYK